jgi:16S rRNA (cytosine1402-N4)-methyltransferase
MNGMHASDATPAGCREAHVPVLLAEAMEALALVPGAHLVDGTYGAGGYAAAALAAGARVTGFDRDPRAIAAAAGAVAASGGRLTLIEAPFSTMAARLGPASADAVALDLGVSSMQLDDPAYGISFRSDGPLDMRMGATGPTAAAFLNSASEEDIADILFRLGDERAARRIARAIVEARPITRTSELAAIVRGVAGRRPGQRIDPATRSFQAIRMHVNDELGELSRGLAAAEQVLVPGGRLAVVSFHSLEDRIVKRFLAERSGSLPQASRHRPARREGAAAPSFLPPARPRRPGAQEVARNPRARSAVLRAAIRSAAPAWQQECRP